MDKVSYVGNADVSAIDHLYKQYKQDPTSVDLGWAKFFEGFEFAQTNYEATGEIPENFVKEFNVINLINGIHFDSSEEMHTLGRLYETLLREMRDAAGDSGEFYTPRAVVRFMVERIDPRIGETVLDPACGTGGFLTEAFAHMEQQADTVEKRGALQSGSLMGVEPKSLPFLLVQMNLLLHGLEAPEIDPGNALRFRLSEIGERERVNVILTNPPFGGEEEAGILSNFPDDRRTAETVARETGATVVDVSQFPGGVKGTEAGYIALMDYLVNSLAKALGAEK